MSNAQCRASRGKPIREQVWCAHRRPCPAFMLSASLLPMTNTKSCKTDASVWTKAVEKLFVHLLEKGRRKGHAEVSFGCSRKPVSSSWEAMCSAAFLPPAPLRLPSSALRRCWREERSQPESPRKARIKTSLQIFSYISGYNGD